MDRTSAAGQRRNSTARCNAASTASAPCAATNCIVAARKALDRIGEVLGAWGEVVDQSTMTPEAGRSL